MGTVEQNPRIPAECLTCVKTPVQMLVCDTVTFVPSDLILKVRCSQKDLAKQTANLQHLARLTPTKDNPKKTNHSGARNASTPGVNVFNKDE